MAGESNVTLLSLPGVNVTLLALYGMNVTLLSRSGSNVTLLSLGSRAPTTATGAIRQTINLFSGRP